MVKLEDMHGPVSVTVFPRVYEQDPALWAEDSVVIVRGEVQMRNDEPTIICESAEPFQVSEEDLNRKEYRIWITIRVSGSDERSISDDCIRVQDVYNYLHNIPGRDHYDLLVVNGEWRTLLTPANNTTHYSPELHQKLEEILGGGTVEARPVGVA
jgi:DNA polymerase-3 subunit alpha